MYLEQFHYNVSERWTRRC